MQLRHGSLPFAMAASIMLTGVFLYDVMGAVVKHLANDYPAVQLSLFRNLFGLIPTLLILFWFGRHEWRGQSLVIRQWKLALARGGLGTFAQISFYLALLHIEFATATTIVFAGPLFVTALSVPILGNKVGALRWLAVLIGFAGVLLVMQPTMDSFTWYAILPLCAALGYASTSVSAKLIDGEVPTAVVNLYYAVGTLTGTFILVLITGGFVPIGSTQDWLWLLAMGCAGGLASYCWTSAYRMAEPGSLSPFQYFGIPFSFCLGWIFFAEAPFDRLIPGVFLIVGGGLIIIWRERALKRARSGPEQSG